MNISIGERSRTEWVDIARGIGIVCVCLGHLGIESIDRVVFTVHMPLFFILSGMFLNGDVPFSEFIKKKSKRLLVPYYVTGGIICSLVFWADVFRKMWERILTDLCSMFIAVLCGSCFKVSHVIVGVLLLFYILYFKFIKLYKFEKILYYYGIILPSNIMYSPDCNESISMGCSFTHS